ncbi:hypothetical protein BJ138DRAFT_1124146 [Hygrophoropsis aurantiaca]|uniref:Uncharacterized protein n=1 Tax=Hygrophoropsis aurantiaca TaxID=72124 RepID=A0ACB8AKF5_9AGAM|nr:hypothetical protein BJ138DRAFT_1124146 [Hygrophoropsis aurantiaca]
MASWIVGAALLALGLRRFHSAGAQYTDVVCFNNYTWADNSLGQSPCVVASYLQAPCHPNGANITALVNSTYEYTPPTTVTPCECNTVTYSLISACGGCQGATWVTWDYWTLNCSGSTSNQQYPRPLPSGTAVPAWAYLALTNGTWDSTAAQQDISAPESSASVVQSSTASSAPSGSASVPSQPNNSNQKSSSNTGAIAGGVVGGVVGLALISAIILFILRRNSRNSSGQMADSGHAPYQDYKYSSPAYGHADPNQTRLYNPDDPTTFPGSPEPSVVYTTSTGPITRPGQFTGVAEL